MDELNDSTFTEAAAIAFAEQDTQEHEPLADADTWLLAA